VLPFATARLTLRELTDADLDDLADLLGDPEVMKYYPRARTRSEAQDWIDAQRRRYQADGFGLWAVELTETGEFVGDCGLTVQHVDGVDEVEVGYHVRAKFHRRGYASEAAAACRDLARDHFAVRRLIAIIAPENVPSQGVARKIGLTLEKRADVFGGEKLIYSSAL
jgi:RimJ/RimL family protein N-acetyltransferase